MRYYFIVGEASGDLHASRLIRSLKERDAKAEFRGFGGDLMSAEGMSVVRHYRDLAYMGFVPVLLHLRTIMKGMRQCREDIVAWNPDVVILVDYAGFNLKIARFLRKNTNIPIYYYIAPKVWAWKEGRVKNFKRDVDKMLCILPFEKQFFEKKHSYPVSYVGNPTANEVEEFKCSYNENYEQYCCRLGLSSEKPVLALLAGSRRQEVKDNLRMMIAATAHLKDCQLVLAGVPSLGEELYAKYLEGTRIKLVMNDTYPLLANARAALVTSGTATLETACFEVPQVVLYKTPLPKVARYVWDHFFSVKYISLVNLIAGREIVPEMMADKFKLDLVRAELDNILHDGCARDAMLEGYQEMKAALGTNTAPDTAAEAILSSLLS